MHSVDDLPHPLRISATLLAGYAKGDPESTRHILLDQSIDTAPVEATLLRLEVTPREADIDVIHSGKLLEDRGSTHMVTINPIVEDMVVPTFSGIPQSTLFIPEWRKVDVGPAAQCRNHSEHENH
jgi:hypothetical protein